MNCKIVEFRLSHCVLIVRSTLKKMVVEKVVKILQQGVLSLNWQRPL